MQKSAARKKIDRLEAEIESKQGIIDKWNSEWHDTQSEIVELQRKLKAAEQQIENRIAMTAEMGSRIGVLESDRDRLTTAVEVLARRLVSPAAEKDRSRAGWRAMSDTWVGPARDMQTIAERARDEARK